MVGIYLSGTGNTKHCMERLVQGLDDKADLIALEDKKSIRAIEKNEVIILGYPTQYSNIPFMVREFIHNNRDMWKGKKVFCVSTMAMFSGDAAGCAARLLKRYGAEIMGGLHLFMPDSIGDCILLKKSLDKSKIMVLNSDQKIDNTIEKIKNGDYPQEGLSILAHLTGLIGQRLWFYGKTNKYSKKLKINDNCIGCGLCQKQCPMQNIKIINGKALASDHCTMCYRCISNCPKKAITLVGKKVITQCRYESYQ